MSVILSFWLHLLSIFVLYDSKKFKFTHISCPWGQDAVSNYCNFQRKKYGFIKHAPKERKYFILRSWVYVLKVFSWKLIQFYVHLTENNNWPTKPPIIGVDININEECLHLFLICQKLFINFPHLSKTFHFPFSLSPYNSHKNKRILWSICGEII